LAAVFGWICCLLVTTACVFGTYAVRRDTTYITPAYSTFEAAFYNGFSKLAWGFALMWIVIACVKGTAVFCIIVIYYKTFYSFYRLK